MKFLFRIFTVIFTTVLINLWFFRSNRPIINHFTEVPAVIEKTKINACIFVLAQESDLKDLLETITNVEEVFNHKHNYPYVIVNNQNFSTTFKITIKENAGKTMVEFGTIPEEQWSLPDWINRTKHSDIMNTQMRDIYKGVNLNYHHMCRYYSGYFFRHELTLKYDYYWRIDTHMKFPCKFPEDPFRTLVTKKKLYGFANAMSEKMNTIPTLLPTFNEWLKKSNAKALVPANNSYEYWRRDFSCHFWNNFELGSFSIFRDQTYLDYFNYLDKSGGFYYERWGDAPVHSFYVMLMLESNKVHRFKDIAYGHDGIFTWPQSILIKCKYYNWDKRAKEQCAHDWDGFKLYGNDFKLYGNDIRSPENYIIKYNSTKKKFL